MELVDLNDLDKNSVYIQSVSDVGFKNCKSKYKQKVRKVRN